MSADSRSSTIADLVDDARTSLSPADAALLQRLRAAARALGGAAVAFSGGVDSALALKVCRDELGDRAVAVTGISDSLAPEELEDVRACAREIGVRLVEVETEEVRLERYQENTTERCYFCKRQLFAHVWAVARREGLDCVADGTNLSDLAAGEDGDRPGLKAGLERDVRSPLAEAGLDKAAVRRIARALGLAVWDKPAMACLASRIPFGERITPEKLTQVARAESALRALGFRGGRVRHHGQVARIELPPGLLARALDPTVRADVVAGVKAAGFAFVALDLEGYRTGSLGEVLSIHKAPSSQRSVSP